MYASSNHLIINGYSDYQRCLSMGAQYFLLKPEPFIER